MASDLNKPLGIRLSKKSAWNRLPFGLVGATILAATTMFGACWVLFVHDPLGGEPVAVVRIDRTKTGLSSRDVGVAEIRKPAQSEQPPARLEQKPARSDPSKPVEEAQTAEPSTDVLPPPAQRVSPRRPAAAVADGQPLSATPVSRVSEKGRYGMLPKVAADGTRPFDLYARPVSTQAASQARIAVIVTGLGLSQTGTQDAIRQLPPAITLAFAPYGSSLERWTQKARQDGHELLLQIPMEPFDYPDNDPGPHTLLTSLTPAQNLDRMQWLMSRLTNYVGIVNYTGARFTSTSEILTPVMKELSDRGLMYVDDGSSSRSVSEGVADTNRVLYARADMAVDLTADDGGLDARLTQLETLAHSKGLAIATAASLPAAVQKIGEWAKTLESRGITLVPISAAIKNGQM